MLVAGILFGNSVLRTGATGSVALGHVVLGVGACVVWPLILGRVRPSWVDETVLVVLLAAAAVLAAGLLFRGRGASLVVRRGAAAAGRHGAPLRERDEERARRSRRTRFAGRVRGRGHPARSRQAGRQAATQSIVTWPCIAGLGAGAPAVSDWRTQFMAVFGTRSVDTPDHLPVEDEADLAGGPFDDRGVPVREGREVAERVLVAPRRRALVVGERAEGPGEAALGEVDLAVARPDAAVGPQEPGGLVVQERVGAEAHRVAPVALRRHPGERRGDQRPSALAVQVPVEHAVVDAQDP